MLQLQRGFGNLGLHSFLAVVRYPVRSCSRLASLQKGYSTLRWQSLPPGHGEALSSMLDVPELFQWRAVSSGCKEVSLQALCNGLARVLSDCELQSPTVRRQALSALAGLTAGNAAAMAHAEEASRALLADKLPALRCAGLLAMLRLGRWGAAGDMAVLLQDADQVVRLTAEKALMEMAMRNADAARAIGHAVAQMLRSTLAAVRLHSTRVLGCCVVKQASEGGSNSYEEALISAVTLGTPEDWARDAEELAARCAAVDVLHLLAAQECRKSGTDVLERAATVLDVGPSQGTWPNLAEFLKAAARTQSASIVTCDRLASQNPLVRRAALGILPLVFHGSAAETVATVEVLKRLASHSNPSVRIAALDGFAVLAPRDSALRGAALQAASGALCDSDGRVCVQSAAMVPTLVSRRGHLPTVSAALRSLQAPQGVSRRAGAEVLAQVAAQDDHSVTRALGLRLEDSDPAVRRAAGGALADLLALAGQDFASPPPGLHEILSRLEHPSLDIRRTAVEALRQLAANEAARPWVVAAVCKCCQHESLAVRRTALQALPVTAHLSDESVWGSLEACLADEAWQLRLTALQSIEELLRSAACPWAVEPDSFLHSVLRCLQADTEPDACVRLGAVHILGRLQRLSKAHAAEALAALQAVADSDPDTDVQEAAQQELSA
ncbi:unnamed protein product [Symbiodinium natans]|uniref:Uncharacterized protein n=1 Tax=Symbiodinium natans TaxID=878477 RepID=A0A812PDI3_9DINO|nr:unnamed protein product [Symbiodinium natans]